MQRISRMNFYGVIWKSKGLLAAYKHKLVTQVKILQICDVGVIFSENMHEIISELVVLCAELI